MNEDFDFIKEYILERIRIDGMEDGFSKGYALRNVQFKNSDVVHHLTKLEMEGKWVEK